jgi:hypothetical protein
MEAMEFRPFFAVVTGLILPALATVGETPATPKGDAAAPWTLGNIRVGTGGAGKIPPATAPRAMAIALGENGQAAMAYNLDACRMMGMWAGKFATRWNLVPHGDAMDVAGNVAVATGDVPGFIAVPAPHPPPKHARNTGAIATPPRVPVQFKGFSVKDATAVLQWEVGGVGVLESPGYDVVLNGGGYFTRTFQVGPAKQPIQILVAGLPQPGGPVNYPTHKKTEGEVAGLEDKERVMQSTPWVHGEDGEVMIWAAGDPDGSMWRLVEGQLFLEVAPHPKGATFQLAYWTAPASDPDGRGAPLFFREPMVDLAALVRTGAFHAPPGK